jgi:hypothetical protein
VGRGDKWFTYPVINMVIFTIMPIVAWLLCFLYLRCRGTEWRTAFLSTSVLWGVYATFLTESLSLFTALSRPFLAAGWAVPAIAAGILLLRAGSFPKRLTIPTLTRTDKLIVSTISVLLTLTLIQAVVSPPNNSDSMTYHMARVMHWMQQGSVAHFPTSDLRQIELNPWAEFAIMQFQMLSGGDYLANVVQWFSMLGGVVGVSYIACLLGATGRGQLFSGLLAATLPMVLLQSSSTQNDLVVSFWLVCFVMFGMISSKEKPVFWIVLMSSSLGLAILTKGTAYIYAFPFMLWFFAKDVRSSWRRTVLKYSAIAIIVLLVNLGHYQRNFRLFHSPLNSGSYPFSNDRMTPAVLLSNISRNVAIHLLTPSQELNRLPLGILESFHSAIGIRIDDPGTTWPNTSFEKIRFIPHDDYSGNPLHICLFGTVFFLVVRNKYRGSHAFSHALATLAGFILFCVMLRWQPWHSRLHLPLFMLFSPVAGVVCAEMKKSWSIPVMTLMFSFGAFVWIIFNCFRPMVSLSSLVSTYPPSIFTTPRRLSYLNNLSKDKRESFLAVIDTVNAGKYKNIGLSFSDNTFEYPIWALTRERGEKAPRIEHINVTNVSNTLPLAPFNPDIILYSSEDRIVRIKGLP